MLNIKDNKIIYKAQTAFERMTKKEAIRALKDSVGIFAWEYDDCILVAKRSYYYIVRGCDKCLKH